MAHRRGVVTQRRTDGDRLGVVHWRRTDGESLTRPWHTDEESFTGGAPTGSVLNRTALFNRPSDWHHTTAALLPPSAPLSLRPNTVAVTLGRCHLAWLLNRSDCHKSWPRCVALLCRPYHNNKYLYRRRHPRPTSHTSIPTHRPPQGRSSSLQMTVVRKGGASSGFIQQQSAPGSVNMRGWE